MARSRYDPYSGHSFKTSSLHKSKLAKRDRAHFHASSPFRSSLTHQSSPLYRNCFSTLLSNEIVGNPSPQILFLHSSVRIDVSKLFDLRVAYNKSSYQSHRATLLAIPFHVESRNNGRTTCTRVNRRRQANDTMNRDEEKRIEATKPASQPARQAGSQAAGLEGRRGHVGRESDGWPHRISRLHISPISRV